MKTIFAVVVLVAALVPSAARAADPQGAMLGPGETVTWGGGPLFGTAIGGSETVGIPVPFCRPPACDTFLLDIEVPPSSDETVKSVVDIQIALEDANQIVGLALWPPGAADDDHDYQLYGVAVRLVEPALGTWRVTVGCGACANAFYAATASATTVPVTPSPMPDGPLGFASTRLAGSGSGATSIAVDGDGHVLVDAPITAAGPSVFRSDDGGATFSRSSHVDALPPRFCCSSAGGDVAFGEGGNAYLANRNPSAVMFESGGDEGSSNLVYPSTDDGSTWGAPLPAGAYVTRPRLGAGHGRDMWLAALTNDNPFAVPGPRIGLWRSGAVFLPAPAPGAGRAVTDVDRPLADRHALDTTYLLYAAGTEIWSARTSDGLAWSETKVADAGAIAGHLASAVGGYGELAVAWSDGEHVRMSSSADGGTTWTGPVQVDQAPSSANVLPAIAATEDRVDVAWYTASGEAWSVVLARTTDREHFTESRVSDDVVHTGAIPGAVFHPIGDSLGLAIGPDGAANLAYANDAYGELVTVYARETTP
jgi:hypothetical protein